MAGVIEQYQKVITVTKFDRAGFLDHMEAVFLTDHVGPANSMTKDELGELVFDGQHEEPENKRFIAGLIPALRTRLETRDRFLENTKTGVYVVDPADPVAGLAYLAKDAKRSTATLLRLTRRSEIAEQGYHAPQTDALIMAAQQVGGDADLLLTAADTKLGA